MIPGGGYNASFKREKADGKHYWHYEPIVCWVDTDSGPVGLVAGPHGLRSAENYAGFNGYSLGGGRMWDTRIVQILAATGWEAVFKLDTGEEIKEPVTLWALGEDGGVWGVGLDGDGLFADPADAVNFVRYQEAKP